MSMKNYNKITELEFESLRDNLNKFSLIHPFNDGVAVAIKKRYNPLDRPEFCLINHSGEIVLDIDYLASGPCFNGLTVATYKGRSGDNRFGVINDKGEIVIPFEYSWIYPFEGEVTTAEKNGRKYGCIDKKGNVVVPFEYESLYFDARNNICYCLLEKKKDSKNKIYVPMLFDLEGNELLFRSNSYNRIENYFRDNPDAQFDIKRVSSISDIQPGSKTFYIVNNGKSLDLFQVSEDLEYIRYDLFSTEEDINAYLNIKLHYVIKKYKSCFDKFSKGVLPVYEYFEGKCKYSFINYSGERVIDYKYDSLNVIYNSSNKYTMDKCEKTFIQTRNGSLFGLIDIFGRELLPCVYKSIHFISNDVVLVESSNSEKDIIRI